MVVKIVQHFYELIQKNSSKFVRIHRCMVLCHTNIMLFFIESSSNDSIVARSRFSLCNKMFFVISVCSVTGCVIMFKKKEKITLKCTLINIKKNNTKKWESILIAYYFIRDNKIAMRSKRKMPTNRTFSKCFFFAVWIKTKWNANLKEKKTNWTNRIFIYKSHVWSGQVVFDVSICFWSYHNRSFH